MCHVRAREPVARRYLPSRSAWSRKRARQYRALNAFFAEFLEHLWSAFHQCGGGARPPIHRATRFNKY